MKNITRVRLDNRYTVGNVTRIARTPLDERLVFKTTPLYQYDYGQVLKFDGVTLPEVYEVHFSNSAQKGTARSVIGTPDGVLIPDEFLLTGEPIYAWIFLHEGENDGATEYMAMIPVNRRPQPVYGTPTPVQQDAITAAVAKIQEIVSMAANNFGLVDVTMDEDGNLIFTRTDGVNIDFHIDDDGHLILGGAA